MKIGANEIKVGMLIEYKSKLWEVLKSQHVKPGKGGAFNQVEMKNIDNGTKINERFRSGENVEKAIIFEEKYNFLYKDKNQFYFINSKTFEQIVLNEEKVSEKKHMLLENLEVKINFHEEKPISIELPKQINLEVIQTDVALKGQTVSSSYKPAILFNGIKVQVPPFINVGDTITIDTKTVEYIKKI